MSKLKDCLSKLADSFSPEEAKLILSSSEKYKKEGLSELDSDVKAINDFYKGLVDEMNELKKELGLPVQKYEEADLKAIDSEIDAKYEQELSAAIPDKKEFINSQIQDLVENFDYDKDLLDNGFYERYFDQQYEKKFNQKQFKNEPKLSNTESGQRRAEEQLAREDNPKLKPSIGVIKTSIGSGKETDIAKAIEESGKLITKATGVVKIPIQQVTPDVIKSIKYRIGNYNDLSKADKKSEQGVNLYNVIKRDVESIGYGIQLLNNGKISLLNSEGKKVYKEPIVRSKDAIESEKQQKAYEKRALDELPISLEHAIVLHIANGVKFDHEELTDRTGVPANEIPLGLTKKGGVSFEFFSQRLAEITGQTGELNIDTDKVANDAAEIVAEYAQKGFKEMAKQRAIEIYQKIQNGGLTDDEIAAMEQPAADVKDEIADEVKAQKTEPSDDEIAPTEFPEAPFQKQSSKSKENIEKVIDVIKKSFPKVKVEYDENLKSAGQLQGNTIKINPYYAGADTPIHEGAHILLDAMGENKVVAAAVKQLKETELWNEIKERYPELNEKQLENELLAEAIGREGENIFKTETEKSRFKAYLSYLFDWFKTKLGLDKNIAKTLAKQIIGGYGTKDLSYGKSEVKRQLIGERGAEKIPFVKNNLSVAKEMDKDQKTSKEIYFATGWEKGKDGKWRYDFIENENDFKISEQQFKVIDDLLKEGDSLPVKIGKLFPNARIYEVYPELKDVQLKIQKNEKAEYDGWFNEKTNNIVLNLSGNILRTADRGRLGELITKTIVHELQHAVQILEGFETGGSPNKETGEKLRESIKKTIDSQIKFLENLLPTSNEKSKVEKEIDNLSPSIIKRLSFIFSSIFIHLNKFF